MTWIFEKAKERAATFGIEGVTYNLTMGVVKNIIPAIASTNALVSAACVTETLKVLSGCNYVLDNYMQYMGQSGVNTTTFQSEKIEDCMVCSIIREVYTFKKTTLLKDVVDHIKKSKDLLKPSFSKLDSDILYISHPPALEQMHAYKLEKSLGQLIEEGIIEGTEQVTLLIVDKNIKSKLTAVIKLTE